MQYEIYFTMQSVVPEMIRADGLTDTLTTPPTALARKAGQENWNRELISRVMFGLEYKVKIIINSIHPREIREEAAEELRERERDSGLK